MTLNVIIPHNFDFLSYTYNSVCHNFFVFFLLFVIIMTLYVSLDCILPSLNTNSLNSKSASIRLYETCKSRL